MLEPVYRETRVPQGGSPKLRKSIMLPDRDEWWTPAGSQLKATNDTSLNVLSRQSVCAWINVNNFHRRWLQSLDQL